MHATETVGPIVDKLTVSSRRRHAQEDHETRRFGCRRRQDQSQGSALRAIGHLGVRPPSPRRAARTATQTDRPFTSAAVDDRWTTPPRPVDNLGPDVDDRALSVDDVKHHM